MHCSSFAVLARLNFIPILIFTLQSKPIHKWYDRPKFWHDSLVAIKLFKYQPIVAIQDLIVGVLT